MKNPTLPQNPVALKRRLKLSEGEIGAQPPAKGAKMESVNLTKNKMKNSTLSYNPVASKLMVRSYVQLCFTYGLYTKIFGVHPLHRCSDTRCHQIDQWSSIFIAWRPISNAHQINATPILVGVYEKSGSGYGGGLKSFFSHQAL